MRAFFITITAMALLAAPAAAQDQRAFASVNFGYQAQDQDFGQAEGFLLYGETGRWETDHSFGGGGTFDISAGYQVLRNLGVGLGYTVRSTDRRDVTVNATVPSPIFTDTLRPASASLAGLEHREHAVHLQALWLIPVTVEFDVTLFAGPSFFTARDQLVEAVAPAEVGGDFSSVTLQDSRIASQRNTATGYNLGVDTRYMILRNVGVGAMLRYSRATVELTPVGNATDPIDIDTGGLEIAAGLRFRF